VSDAERPPPARRAPERVRRRLGLILAVAVPALAAAAAVLLLSRGDGSDPTHASAALVPNEGRRDLGPAATRALRPIVALRGHVGAAPGTRKPSDGGPRPALPERISIPAAKVDTIVDRVGTKADGAIRVPGVGRAGWYEGGPRPGEAGRAVIIGHLDTSRGPGLFARVPSLTRGQAIDVTDRRGHVHRYRVAGRAQVRKDHFPTEEVYGGGPRPVLVLVTCGGPYDQESGYRDNILVFARAA
jgi:hypothetical protein